MKNWSSRLSWLYPPDSTITFLVLLLFSLFTFSLCRILFYIAYHPFFSDIETIRIAAGFVRGLRFDLSVIAAIMGPFFLLFHLLPPKLRSGRIGSFILFLPIPFFWLSIFLLAVDIYYYGETGRRISYEIFMLFRDKRAILGIVLYYPISLFLWIGLCILFYWVWMKLYRIGARWFLPSRGIIHEAIYLLLFVAFSIIAARGGLQVKPLRPSYAFADDNLILGHLALNPIFTAAHTAYQGETWKPNYYPEQEALSVVRGLLHQSADAFPDQRFPMVHSTRARGKPGRLHRSNVVIILMESWAAKYMGSLGAKESLLPNFDRLSKDGILFTNFYANGQRSIEGMACLCCALPTFRDTLLIGGSLEQNSLMCIGQIFKNAGYKTLFIHGARTGSFGFDAFSRRAGFERYLGMEDFKLGKDEFDPVWGVYDGVALNRVNEELRKTKEPFLALWFSLSAHSPYNLPSNWKRRYPASMQDGELMNTILYSDDSLGRFFEAARKEKYFANTIFVILADHTSGTAYSSLRERFHIPCLIYAPGRLAPRRIDTVGSQLDIMPTLVDLTGISALHHAFGQSLLNPSDYPGIAIIDNVNTRAWIHGRLILVSDQEKPLGLFDYVADPNEKHNLIEKRKAEVEKMTRELLSFIQVSKGLNIENRLFPPPYLAHGKGKR